MNIEFMKWFIENHYFLAFFAMLMIYYLFLGVLNTICIVVRGRQINETEERVEIKKENNAEKEDDTIGK